MNDSACWRSDDGKLRLFAGDCLDGMRALPDCSIDSVVTDPPYLIGFMGRQWDTKAAHEHLDWHLAWATEAFRVLKPGGHMLAFGGTRTYHRMACAVEDAGFEIRDCLMYLFGSGFPKSLNVSKAIDKAAGAEREVVGTRKHPTLKDTTKIEEFANAAHGQNMWAREWGVTALATPEAAQWSGWGTALKPSHEPIVLARKPLVGNVAQNVLEWGTGAINVDGCRVPTEEVGQTREFQPREDRENWRITGGSNGSGATSSLGRWPANVIFDEEAARMLDEQTGVTSEKPRQLNRNGKRSMDGWGLSAVSKGTVHGDSGGASRFFYCAKASRAERTCGGKVENKHPTVKPLALMQYLVRLITPPGGVVLDPFAGSGTTGIAAMEEGFGFIGYEKDAENYETAAKRLAVSCDNRQPSLFDLTDAVQ